MANQLPQNWTDVSDYYMVDPGDKFAYRTEEIEQGVGRNRIYVQATILCPELDDQYQGSELVLVIQRRRGHNFGNDEIVRSDDFNTLVAQANEAVYGESK